MSPTYTVTVLATILAIVVAVVVVNAHECIHDQIRNRAGTGIHAPTINVKYDFHESPDFIAAHKKHPTKRHRPASQLRQAEALQVNPAGTLGNMRFKSFFDTATCPGSDCGRCDYAGQTVQTFEGGTVACTADDVLSTKKRNYINNKLMPEAMKKLSTLLRINPVVGNLNPGSGYCGSPGTPIPADHTANGVPDADFIIYVTAAPKADASSLTVAWALSCANDGSGRPTVAHVNFVPKRLDNAETLDAIKMEGDTMTAFHEICHALGFSNPFFGAGADYVDMAGNPQTGGTTTVASAALGKTRTFINSPRVVKEVREYFGCNTMVGAEIEEQGGAGTANSHFEKRIYQQDIMAGISTTVAAFPSRILLAYFEDTGHYLANYSAIDHFDFGYTSFGRGKGCSFVDEKCNSASNKASGEFCFTTDTQNTKLCSFDGLAKGYCGVTTSLASVPSHQQYFGDASTGSSIQVDDHCPSPLYYSNQRCVDIDVAPVQGGGERYGGDSRCFQSNLQSSSSSSLIGGGSTKTTEAAKTTRCFQAQCTGDGKLNVVVDLRIYPCPKDGSAGKADLTGLSGYNGDILCPPAARYCPSGGWNGSTGMPAMVPSPETSTTYAPSYAKPLPGTCLERQTGCAAKLMHLMPWCREYAFQVGRCFGTDCDITMASFVRSVGGAANCSDRATFAKYCVEGYDGVDDVCALASAGRVIASLIVAVMLVLAVLL